MFFSSSKVRYMPHPSLTLDLIILIVFREECKLWNSSLWYLTEVLVNKIYIELEFSTLVLCILVW
jgi:hypothetical protein